MEYFTHRLRLREFTRDDKENLYKLFKEDFISTYEAHLQMADVTDVENYIAFHLKNATSSSRTHFYYTIESKENLGFLGVLGYSFVGMTEIGGKSGRIMELEYYLLEAHWGKGYMTEALEKAISLAFLQPDIVKLFAQCHKENIKSEKVMMKCGMLKAEKQPLPKLYNGILKENIRYELTIETHNRN